MFKKSKKKNLSSVIYDMLIQIALERSSCVTADHEKRKENGE